MKITARVLTVLLVFAMLFSLMACSSDPVESSPEESQAESTAESTVEDMSTDNADESTDVSGEASVPEGETTGSVGNSTTATKNNKTTTTRKKGETVAATRATAIASDTDKTKYAELGLKMKEFNITNKKLRMFTGPERTMSDYLSTTAVPGVWEILKAYYDIDLELVSCGDYNDWYTKLAMLSLSDNSPDFANPLAESYPYDIVKGNILPLDEYFDFKDSIWDSTRDVLEKYTWNGKHYHAIYDDGQYMEPLYYNPKIFKKNGVKTPRECLEDGTWNLQTMLDMAVELTQDTDGDGKTDLWGVGGLFFTYMPVATGKSLVTIKGKNVTCNITDPVFATAAQFIYDLGPSGKYKVATAFHHDNADLFVSGQVAMHVTGHYRAWSTFKEMWKAGTIDAVPFPAMEEGGSFYKSGTPSSYVIYKKAKNIEGAKALIWTAMYLRTDEVEDKLEAYGKKNGVDSRYASWLLTDIPGVTTEQYENLVDTIWDPDNKYNMKSNPNNWHGWLNNGHDYGFQYAHEKQWSTIVNIYKNQFNAAIEENIDSLELLTE